MTVDAVLFDVDGTLVDSNYLHIEAWQRACESLGRPLDAWRVHRAIGMDSSSLLEQLLGDEAERLGDDASSAHAERYRELSGRLRPLPGARELLHDLRSRGITVVLATSAPEEELTMLLDVLELQDADLPMTSAEDVDEAKPDPGIVQVALERAGVTADRALFVGDSTWDMIAAGRAGVRAMGVRSGGYGADELTEAGAGEVVDDVAALVRRGASWPA